MAEVGGGDAERAGVAKPERRAIKYIDSELHGGLAEENNEGVTLAVELHLLLAAVRVLAHNASAPEHIRNFSLCCIIRQALHVH